MTRFRVFLMLAFILFTTALHAAEQSVTLGSMAVTVWSEETRGTAKQPVIIFSHGFHGCATQSRFLMEAFASGGYLVFAPDHQDAACHGGASHWIDGPQVSFGKPGLWTETAYQDRAEDIRHVIDAIREDERFRARADLSRLGLAGHSLGGYTVLGLAGAWPHWKLTGLRAVLALSPYTQPFILQKTLRGLSAPVMYQGGTHDVGITPAVRKSMGAYDQSAEPKYYVEFDKAGHFAWTDMGRRATHEPIVAYSVAFMDHYVKGELASLLLTRAVQGVARLRYASDVGHNDRGGP